MVEKQSKKQIHHSLLPSIQKPSLKIQFIAVDKLCIWISLGSHIHVYSSKVYIIIVYIQNVILLLHFYIQTKDKVTSPLMNFNPIVSMALNPDTMTVWVADTSGFVSIWDAQVKSSFSLYVYFFIYILYKNKTLHRCFRFQVHPQNCAQSMSFMHGYFFMAVGRDLVAIHCNVCFNK